MSFYEAVRARSAREYADFLIPHLEPSTALLDAGCGVGTISVGLAAYCQSVTAIDAADQFAGARDYASRFDIANVHFEQDDIYAMQFPDASFDAAFCHSVLEALSDPVRALKECYRVLEPGAVIGAASVDYGGAVIGGDDTVLLERFYRIREQLWIEQALADPFAGRRLRGWLVDAGFERVDASAKYLSYGNRDAVAQFGSDRAADCDDPWYATSAIEAGLATPDELGDMRRAWQDWSVSPHAFFAFAWIRALGWKP